MTSRSASRAFPPALLIVIIVCITAGVYAGSAGFEFVFDDHNQIESNPAIQSWSYFPSYFVHHVWRQTTSTALYYRPLFLTWLLLNYEAFGLNPAAWHLSAVALHLLATVLVFFLARRLLGDAWKAAVAALLFGVYPVHVEAVDWVSGATEPLLAVFVVSAFLCFLKRAENRIWPAAALVLSALAMLAKETAVVLPAVILAYEWLQTEGSRPALRLKTAVIAALPYALVAAAYLAVRTAVLGAVAQGTRGGSLVQTVETWPAMLLFYISHLLFPFPLSLFYDLTLVTRPGLRNFLVPVIVLTCLAAALFWIARRSDRVAFLAFWVLLWLVPLLIVPFFGNLEIVHDRYLYAPSIAYCILLVMILDKLRPLLLRYALTAIAVVLCAFATTGR